MQMTTEARAWLDATVKRILARHPLGDAERAGITYELMSHLHAGGEERATAAGRSEVAREDLEAAFAAAGGEDALAAAFVQPLARPVERVGFGRRLGALAIDAVLVGILLLFTHQGIEYALEAHMGIPVEPQEGFVPLWMRFLPWGFHDPSLSFAIQALFTLVSGALVVGYFAWFEAVQGRTPGKRALELRVMRADGRPLTGCDAVLRNLVKVSPPFFALDTVLMLLAFPDAKQRLSDRLVGTIVVRA